MQAQDRRLPQWFERVSTAQIALPRFQREEAWSYNRVAGLLTTVLRGLPAGAALILQVGDTLQFVCRHISGAPVVGEATNELLLDGQQRLTALWKAMNDGYDDRIYLVSFSDPDEADGVDEEVLEVISVKYRRSANGQRLPQWLSSPSECWARGCIPVRLLKPGDMAREVDDWVVAVVGDDLPAFREIQSKILKLRACVSEFNLPFLALPPTTKKDVALDVFIKMNTSAVVLSAYDIIVAQAEAATGESLHDLVSELDREVPQAKAYRAVQDLVLDTAALMQNRTPNNSGYLALDMERLVNDWVQIVAGVRGMTQFLSSEGVFDRARLATTAVLPVIASLWPSLPTAPDALGEARRVLRKYLWRASFTDRYESAAASKTLNDRRHLLAYLEGRGPEAAVPVFDEANYPMPTPAQLAISKWPKSVAIVPRGILSLALRCGAADIADGVTANREHLGEREYHHLYPASLLRDAGLSDADAYLALNCALITWRTNRTISNKLPVHYLRERVEGNALGDDEIRQRLRTHLVPFDELQAADNAADIVAAYQRFIAVRAGIVHKALARVWGGAEIADLGPLFEPYDEVEIDTDDSAESAHAALVSASEPIDAIAGLEKEAEAEGAAEAPEIRLGRAIAKWESSRASELGYPKPEIPYSVDGRVADALYLGPDGQGAWVIVQSGSVLGTFETLIAAREVYRTL